MGGAARSRLKVGPDWATLAGPERKRYAITEAGVADVDRCRVPDMKAEVVKQIRGFCKKLKPRINHDGCVDMEIVYSGKPPIGSGDDDYVIVLMMAPYHEDRFFKNPRNRAYFHGIPGK